MPGQIQELEEVYQIEKPHTKSANLKWSYNYYYCAFCCNFCPMAIAL